ncbi:MAG: hypothetical protein M0019_08985 [Actinomycetota bacterium]|nr:hypothetical protein [Actinomycetota bacterium]
MGNKISKTAINSSRGEGGFEFTRANVSYLASFSLFIAGVIWRIHYDHFATINSDEAVVGLMAKQISHGHFFALFWGQYYGGEEAYVVAVIGRVFGFGQFALKATPLVLTIALFLALAFVLSIQIKKHFAFLVASLVMVWPLNSLVNSLKETGFRQLQALLIVTTLAFFTRGLVSLDEKKGSKVFFFIGGLSLGLSIWASPEAIVVAPGLLYLAYRVISIRYRAISTLIVSLVATLLGAAPWIVATVNTHFKTISVSSGGTATLGYLSRLEIVSTRMFAQALSLLKPFDTTSLASSSTHLTLSIFAIVFIGLISLIGFARAPRLRAFTLTLAIYPFVYSIFPNSSFYEDGRYALYLPALILVSSVAAISRGDRREKVSNGSKDPMSKLSIVISPLLFLTAIISTALLWRGSEYLLVPVKGAPLPLTQEESLVRGLENAGIKDIYANYWVAYVVDYLANGAITASQLGGSARWPAYDIAVQRASHASYVTLTNDQPLAILSTTYQNATLDPLPITYEAAVKYFNSKKIFFTDAKIAGFSVLTPSGNVTPGYIIGSMTK